MPAIQPARLKQQADLLAGHFNEPAALVRSLHHLLDFYADRAHRPGQAGTPPPLLAAYRVRPPVLRELARTLGPLAAEDAEAGLALADALWAEPYLEFHMLAASLLGQINPQPPDRIILRAKRWAGHDLEPRLVDALLIEGFARLRQECPAAIIGLLEEWLGSAGRMEQQLGLRALLPLINDLSFENLPVFFRLLAPFARQAPPALRPDVLDVLVALARRSPAETAFFLRQNLDAPNNPDTPWLIRQCLNEFPSPWQESLRETVRGLERRPRGA